MRLRHLHRHLLLAIFLALGTATADEWAANVEQQRQAFRDVLPAAQRGDWGPAEQQQALLSTYVLWPDLRAAYLRTRLDEPADEQLVLDFVDRYYPLKPARELRYELALALGRSGRYPQYLKLYRRAYADLGVARLDCLALHAEIELGAYDQTLVERAIKLWLIGKSQVDECDPVFAHLRDTGDLDTALYRQRYELAVDENKFRLARYLARSIDEAVLDEANAWVSAREAPERFIADSFGHESNPPYLRQLAYAVKQIAYRDPEKAAAAWSELGTRFRFPDEVRHDVDRHLALWLARLNKSAARRMLATLPDEAVDQEVRRWRIRTALRATDWPAVAAGIEALPDSERQKEEWQYWHAVALDELGAEDEAKHALETLARKRTYYGFLAADRLGLPYDYQHDQIKPDPEILAKLSADPALVRARELFLVGLDGRGRSEWDAAIRKLNEIEALQAALLAHRWGWHSRAIATAAKNDHLDDLELRYPLPHRESFQRSASDSGIGESWAYGIARSESIFMRDIRSVSGAVGLMQLLPETGRHSARELGQPYSGWATLVDPESNIRLGTFYLGKLYQRFDQNPALATAAYNAGPLRVEQWLPPAGSIDAKIWIENIPFDQTRNYVRRVLASEAIFHWRMNGKMRRVSDQLPAVRTPDETAQSQTRRCDQCAASIVMPDQPDS